MVDYDRVTSHDLVGEDTNHGTSCRGIDIHPFAIAQVEPGMIVEVWIIIVSTATAKT